MLKKFPDWKTDREADEWLEKADLTEYDLSDMKKIRFEIARKDTSISLRLPASLHAAIKARAVRANIPMQRLIRAAIEDFVKSPTVKVRGETAVRAKVEAGRKSVPSRRGVG